MASLRDVMRDVDDIVRVVAEQQPVSPFALRSALFPDATNFEALRAALRIAQQTGQIRYNEHWELVLCDPIVDTPADLVAADPSSAPGAADPASASGLPTPDPDSPPVSPPLPTAPPNSESHPAAQTESQRRALCYAIQTEVGLLSRLEDELSTFLLLARPQYGDRVRPGACALLRRAILARQEYEASGRLLQGGQPGCTA